MNLHSYYIGIRFIDTPDYKYVTGHGNRYNLGRRRSGASSIDLQIAILFHNHKFKTFGLIFKQLKKKV